MASETINLCLLDDLSVLKPANTTVTKYSMTLVALIRYDCYFQLIGDSYIKTSFRYYYKEISL